MTRRGVMPVPSLFRYCYFTMDPVCHTLVGAAIAETGLKHKTVYATATLLVAANLPDIDVVALFAEGTFGLAFRRGITHGLPAMLLLPPLLALAMLGWYRLRKPDGEPRPILKWLIALAYIGVLSHPLLDLLNVYGVRLLAPISDRWFYGDVLFIVDPILWVILVWGVVTARRKIKAGNGSARSAQASIAAASVYIILMAGGARLFEASAERELIALGIEPTRIMVAPVPLNPFTRWVVAEADGRYLVGYASAFSSPRIELYDEAFPVGPDSDAAVAATTDSEARRFLRWARFPFYQTERRVDGSLVWIGDARYTIEPEGSWAGLSVFVPIPSTGSLVDEAVRKVPPTRTE